MIDKVYSSDSNLSDSTSSSRNALVIIGAFAVGQSIQVANGVIHPGALGWLFLAIICLTMAMMPSICRRLKLLAKINTSFLLIGCIVIQGIELLVWDLRWGSHTAAMVGCLMLIALGVVLTFRIARWGLILIVLGHFFAGAMTIASSPHPGIDVWYFQHESTAALLHGDDPYGVRFRDIYGEKTGFYAPGMALNGWLTYSYPYPPLMLIMTAPGRIFGDVRWAHLAALELSAILLVLAAGVRLRSVLAMGMMLLDPRGLLVIKAGWTEPMVLLMVAAVIYTVCKLPKWTWLTFGLLLAIKQYTIVVAPLLLLIYPPRDVFKLMLKAGIVAAFITAPFLIWNPVSFVRSVVLWQLRQPFRSDALSIAALMDWTLGFKPGLWLCGVATLIGLGLVYRRSPRDAMGFVLSLTFVLLLFFATNKQAFCNYYFLVMGVGCGAVALQKSARNTGQMVEILEYRVAA